MFPSSGLLPAACKRYWKGRSIFAPSGRTRGVVVGVRTCQHRHLCDGVTLRILWDDELATYNCSYDVEVDELGRHQLTC